MARADENHTNRMSSGSDTQAHPLLGDYEFQRKIGSGAFGTVWQFFDPENGRDVAVKRLSIVENLDAHAAKMIKAFENEIKLMQSLHHRRIVHYYDCLENCLIMEYVPGGALTEIIPLQENAARKFIFQVLEGLQYLHSNRIVHKDVKCANILRDTAGKVKLSDFGISDRIPTFTQYDLNNIKGTIPYMAPELFGENSAMKPKIDICIGRIVANQMKYSFADDVSSEAKSFVRLLLEYDQEIRPSAETALTLSYIISLGFAASSSDPNARNEISTNVHNIENVQIMEHPNISIMETMEIGAPGTSDLSSVSKFEETLRLLQQLKVKPNEIYGNTIIDSKLNTTLLHYVCEKGNPLVLKELLQQNCNMECRTKGLFGQDSGRTPMHFAALNENYECLQSLIAAGVNVNCKDNFKFTPLHCAASNDRLNCLKILIAHGATIDAKNEWGRTPMHVAARNGCSNCLQELISHGAEVNAQSKCGNTPLHEAAYWGKLNCLKVLIAAGADPVSRNNRNKTANDEAKGADCIDYLNFVMQC